MTNQYPDAWGTPAPDQSRRPWSERRIVVSAVAAVVVIAGGTTAVVAATHEGSSVSAGTGPGGSGLGSGPGGGFGDGGLGPGGFGDTAGTALADALHGDFVLADGTTERLQTGTVTAVSSTGITLRSTDGYTRGYVVDSGTTVDRGADSIGRVAKGHTVTLVAKVAGRTATATTIEDTSIDDRGGRSGPGGGSDGPPGA